MFKASVKKEKFLFILLLLGIIGGVLLSIELPGAVRISLLDATVFLTAMYFFYIRKSLVWKRFVFLPFIIIGSISLVWQINSLGLLNFFLSSLYLVRYTFYTLILTYPFHLQRRFWFKSLTVFGVAFGGIGLLQYFLYPNLRNLSYLGWDPHEFRVFSTFLDPNFTGVLLVLAVLTSMYSRERGFVSLRYFLLSVLLMIVPLFLTYSRGAFAAFILGMSTWFLLKKKYLLLHLLIFSFFAVLYFLPRPGGEGVDLFRTMSVSSRIKNSLEAISLFNKSPLLGYGFDSLRFVNTQDKNGDVYFDHSGAGFHSSWLVILTTTGVVGLLVFLEGVRKIFILLPGWNNLSAAVDLHYGLSVGLTLAIHGIFDNSMFYPFVFMFVLLCLLGLFIPRWQKPRQSERYKLRRG